MNPPNRPDLAKTAVVVPTIRAYLGPAGGGAPIMGDESQEWEVDGWSKSAGSTPDVITLIRRMTKHIVDRKLQENNSREVEVWLVNTRGQRLLPLAWGETAKQSLTIAEGNESEMLLASIERWHFGNPLTGETVFDKKGGDAAYIAHVDPMFNPRIDGRITTNRSAQKEVDDTNGEGKHFLWVDPESARTPEAYAEHWAASGNPAEMPDAWELYHAVETLQQILNADETFLKNAIVRDPDTGEPIADFTDALRPDNVRLKRGSYLPALLDALLHPRGYNWCVDVTETQDDNDDDDGNDGKKQSRKIRIFKRGEGTKKSLRLQGPGSDLDPLKTSLQLFSATIDLSRLANRIVAHGSRIQKEATLPLERGWSSADDDLTAEQLTRGVDDSQFDDKPDVYRKLIANTSGEYTNLRAEITETLDLSDLGQAFQLPKRRPLDVPLTYRGPQDDEAGGLRRPVFLEWRPDTGTAWSECPGGPFNVLENECGIRFNDDAPPAVLLDYPNAEFRITGTITGDKCLEATAARQTSSPLSGTVTLLLDVSDRYHQRFREATGVYISSLSGAHDERDDQDDLVAFVETVREIEDVAGIEAQVVLFGLRSDYQIGDLITDVDGRAIVLNRTANADATPKYLQVVGIAHSHSAQTTTLTMEAYDATA